MIAPILRPMRDALTPSPTRFGPRRGDFVSDSSSQPAPAPSGNPAPRPFHERDPWGEKAHTYLRAHGFPAASDWGPGRWSDQRQWTMAELGTGTGCSLACLVAAFERHATPDQRLHYVGFENDPTMLDWWRDPANRTLIPPSERAALEAILARPLRSTQGVSRWRLLDGRATVTLVLGDAAGWLPNFSFLADAWFLDAYEPAVETLLWSREVLGHVARLTRAAGTASTFSAAGAVRTGLDAAGFDVQRVAGFDTKRHMTVATRRSGAAASRIQPWFTPPPAANPERVTILGAGLAGAWCARTFAERGAQVTVIDPQRSAPRASDVPLAAATQPDGSWQSEQVRVHDAAWHLLASRCHDLGLPHRLLPIATASGTSYRIALVARPRELIAGLLAHPLVSVATDAPHAPFVVHATAFSSTALERTVCARGRPEPNAGSMCRVTLETPLHNALMDHGHALPTDDGRHAWIGATNHPGQAHAHGAATHAGATGGTSTWSIANPMSDVSEVRARDAIIERLLGAACPQVEAWTGTRAASPDHVPMIGPVADDADFSHAYAAIRHGPLARQWPDCRYLDGVWCSLGHGSHGMLTTPLAAELIADLAFGTPRCIADELLPFLLPQRFALRALRRERP